MTKSKLYTRTGDAGTTSLVGGARIAKDSVRLEAYGAVDELNSWLGLVSALTPGLPVEEGFWVAVQSRMFDIGSYLATDPDGEYATLTANPVTDKAVRQIEAAIDSVDSVLPRLNSFVIPGGTVATCQAHIARTVCRRAERRIITLSQESPVDAAVLQYVNRLSDLLFAVARWCNINAGESEIFWVKDC